MRRTDSRLRSFVKLVSVVGALVLAFVAYQSVGAEADESDLAPVQRANGNAVPGSYLVFYRDGTSNQIDRAGLGLRPLSSSQLGYSAALDNNQLAQVRRDPNVELVVEDFYVRIPNVPSGQADGAWPQSPPVPWSLDRIDQRTVDTDRSFNPNGNGNGIKIYVMDSGVNQHHPELSGRVVGGTSFVGSQHDPLDDCQGHGTAVASAAAGQSVGVANEASIYSLRIGDCGSQFAFSAVMTALDWVAKNNTGPAVLNLSFGDRGQIPNPLTTDHVIYHYYEAVERVTDAGVTVVAASGNDGTSPCSNPASFGPTISVGATDWGDTQASFSNYGKCVDILAPGVQIKIAAHTGGHRFASGTSLAAPYVAGAAAIYLAKNPAASPDAVRSHLLSNATTNALHGLQGSPNRLLYVAPGKAVTVVQRPVNNECWQQESLASASDREPQSCSEAALPAAGVSNLIEAYGQQDAPQETTGNTCFGPIAAGSGTGNAKQAFETPIAEGGCGMAWDDQLGHQCRWVDEPTAGWQCFGAQPNRPRQPNPQTTPRPAVDPPFSQSDVDQPQQVQLQNDQSNDTLEARNAAAETKPVGQSGSQPEGSVCRSRVVAGVNLDQARQDFAKPVDQGGCGIAWDDQNLGHQCEWISGSPQGWQCFGTVQ